MGSSSSSPTTSSIVAPSKSKRNTDEKEKEKEKDSDRSARQVLYDLNTITSYSLFAHLECGYGDFCKDVVWAFDCVERELSGHHWRCKAEAAG